MTSRIPASDACQQAVFHCSISFHYESMSTLTWFADLQAHSVFDTSVFGVQDFPAVSPQPFTACHGMNSCCAVALLLVTFNFTVIQISLV